MLFRSAHPDQEQHQYTVLDLLKDLDAHMIPMLTVYNKSDLVDEDLIAMNHPSIFISAYDGTDLRRLLLKIEVMLKVEWESYVVYINPYKMWMLYILQ